jgi:hypothetical protein
MFRWVRDLWWRAKWWFQRRLRGWDDRDTWSLDVAIARFTLPRLKAMRDGVIGFPAHLADMGAWQRILDDIIYAMEVCADDERWYEAETDHRRVSRGLRLFGRHFRSLWN